MENVRLFVWLQTLSGHRWLRATRRSLILLLPVTFIGAIALLIGSFPYATLLPQIPPQIVIGGSDLAMLISNASYGIIAVCLAVLVSYCLAVETREKHLAEVSSPVVAAVSLVNFFIFARFFSPNSQVILGTPSVLAAIIVAVFSTEVFCFLFRIKRLKFAHQTHYLDPDLDSAICSIVPAIATVVFFLITIETVQLFSIDWSSQAGDALVSLNNALGSQLPGLLVFELLGQLLWFFGIHGAHILQNLYSALFEINNTASQIVLVSGRFLNLYAHAGGAGSTLGLLLAIFICVKKGETRQVAKYAMLPSLFNINEIVIYGLPIAFNPVFLIPFLLVPLVQIVVSYPFIIYGLVPMNVTLTPWMTPPLLAGTLNSGSWYGGALQLTNIFLSALIYLPFVRFSEQQKKAENMGKMRHALAAIETIKLQQATVLSRTDNLGHTARSLLRDFMQDLGSSQVYLAYQPQHDQRGTIVGVEALLRWEHRQYGYISPAVICALAEESNDIVHLGRWVLNTACQQLKRWKLAGIEGLQMSVNLSPLQLEDATLLAFIDECLDASHISPSELALELTETQNVAESARSDQLLNGLQERGIHLEMDDFGMGYSSLLYIRRYHFSAIKLDAVLTKNVLQDVNCRDIIASVVQLARARNIRVVAEYVETREQQVLLERLGCDVFQGYLYSPALVEEKCLRYLQNSIRADVLATQTTN